jgi:hypothetical protein
MVDDGPLALTALRTWLHRVGERVADLRWQLVGYGQDRQGRPDETQPLYSMANPNADIDELLRGLEDLR